ncbi:hypothetical protein MA16_Dca021126 [Dendrobium catenatum]|uniref:Uncharacterized protein n=1 Tax=Dendrobium catenatum TaxID=906689 RepID=A0A2I0VVH8_9ASPA|nr:hypothetical protein MA16_Dca021126 [Dendrobium catenatum]
MARAPQTSETRGGKEGSCCRLGLLPTESQREKSGEREREKEFIPVCEPKAFSKPSPHLSKSCSARKKTKKALRHSGSREATVDFRFWGNRSRRCDYRIKKVNSNNLKNQMDFESSASLLIQGSHLVGIRTLMIEEQFEASDDILSPEVVVDVNSGGILPDAEGMVGINSNVKPGVETLNKFDVLSELLDSNEAKDLDAKNENGMEEGEILESNTEPDFNGSDNGLIQQPEFSRNENKDLPVINPSMGGNQSSEKNSKLFKELRSLGSSNVIPHNRKVGSGRTKKVGGPYPITKQ